MAIQSLSRMAHTSAEEDVQSPMGEAGNAALPTGAAGAAAAVTAPSVPTTPAVAAAVPAPGAALWAAATAVGDVAGDELASAMTRRTALKRERDALSRQIRAQEKRRVRTLEKARGLSDKDLLSIMTARAAAKARADAKPKARARAKANTNSAAHVLRPWSSYRSRCRSLCAGLRV